MCKLLEGQDLMHGLHVLSYLGPFNHPHKRPFECPDTAPKPGLLDSSSGAQHLKYIY